MRIVFGGPNFATFSVERDSETAGEPAAVLAEGIPLGDLPSIDATAIGFTVGAHAGYQFQLKEYPLDVDYADTFVSYAYDAYGRKISETNFGGADVGFVETAKTLFVYDGWRLLEEVSVDPSDNSTHVVADDVPGPAYVDDIVANRRDLDHSGSMASDEQFYHLTDQQYSTVALLAGDGNPAERYGYDPFGAPSLYNGSGDPEYDPHNTAELTTKSDFNPNLYTGQRYLPEAKLYDARNRLYNPAQGRFLTGDPIGNFGDEANMGNAYAYVGNNPGSGVDPFGEERWGEQSYLADVADVGYGYFIGGPLGIVTGTASSIWNYDKTANGLVSLAGNLADDPVGTAGNLAGSFYHQFDDSDTAGQAAFGAATSIVPGAVGAAKALNAARGVGAARVVAAVEEAGAVTGMEAGANAAEVGATGVESGRDLELLPNSEATNGVPARPQAIQTESSAPSKNGVKLTGILEQHHQLPKQFAENFARAGLNIEDYVIPLDKALHRLNPSGLHTNNGGNWNKVWGKWLMENPNAQAPDILEQLAKMRKKFGLE